jgi:hypothetical protein
MARPRKCTSKLSEQVCRRLIDGQSLLRICRDAKLPSRATVYRWLSRENPTPEELRFRDSYARAREWWAESVFDELLEIADDEEVNPHVTRNRLDARKWALARQNPRKYSDRMQLDHSGEVKTGVIAIPPPQTREEWEDAVGGDG